MFDKLKSMFSPADDVPKADLHEAHVVAAAVLLVEAARLDGHFDERERKRIASLLTEKFDLSQESATALFELAIAKQEQSVEIFGFTNEIKNAFDEDKRIEMIEMLWEVVYSDNELDAYEANLLRRVSGLLHVTDRQSGDARKRVRNKLGLTSEP
jgi:uncharacterized tellurite resistance protein B-like protein